MGNLSSHVCASAEPVGCPWCRTGSQAPMALYTVTHHGTCPAGITCPCPCPGTASHTLCSARQPSSVFLTLSTLQPVCHQQICLVVMPPLCLLVPQSNWQMSPGLSSMSLPTVSCPADIPPKAAHPQHHPGSFPAPTRHIACLCTKTSQKRQGWLTCLPSPSW